MAGPPCMFKYHPLPTFTSIRLVTPLQKDSNICISGTPLPSFSMKVVDLNDNPKFQSLSYTWGSPFPPDDERSKEYAITNLFPIAIDGQIMFITKNLYEFLRQLRNNELDVDKRVKPYNKTHLIRAAEAGNGNDVGYWLSHGADVAAQDKFGETALHYAAENGHFEVVKQLVHVGSSLELRDSVGRTPLDCARMRKRHRYVETIEFLEHAATQTDRRLNRRPLGPLDSEYFWIDAICINQEDTLERNTQVAIMNRIYTQASTVARLNVVTFPYGEGSNIWYTNVLNNFVMKRPEEQAAERNSDKGALEYLAIVNLFRRSWFQRVWIIQEVALARQIKVTCGSYLFDYQRMFQFFHGRHLLDRPLTQALGLARWKVVSGSEASTLFDIRLRTSKDAYERCVLDHHVQEKGITLAPTWEGKLNPRDKLFALLGIARLPDDPSQIILPDYSEPASDVFIRFGHVFMQGSPDEPIQDWHSGKVEVFECLEGLSYVQESPAGKRTFEEKVLPSWVPDFTVPLVTPRLWAPRFSAGLVMDTGPKILPGEHSRTLCVNGICLDEVECVETQIGKLTETHFYPPGWLEFISALDSVYPLTGQNRVNVLWRTLMTNQLSETSQDPARDAMLSFRRFMKKALWSLSGNLRYQILEYAREDEIGNPRGRVAIDGKSDFDSAFTHYYRGRLLFRTKKGYLGLGPWSMKRGDEVWVLLGARTPFILRSLPKDNKPQSNSRTFVGETYVHGVMNGEAMKDQQGFHPVILY
ncbi:hypothetical protein BDV25DRAFT_167854 [Aspergillus avenaceus]|uniref:Heterokaryon incompatibility domain-containing protein n=1 Tax=Aspergillus avenaceus TaxID=36643 RepID=A0A5N6TSX3_ASPAV|nr:hypothetical protein BDV25DRAFT_167854 [Aspergillus avenaceus]